jgi:hypothetical protein
MEKRTNTLKPQDIVILLKLISNTQSSTKPERIVDLSYSLGISASEISLGLRRLQNSALITEDTKKPLKNNALEFLKFGLKYVFPVKLSSVSRGVPTSHSASPLKEKITSNEEEQYVWPCDEGNIRGHSVTPLYPSVPLAALKDTKLHELLALVDAIRIGRSREQKIAFEELEKILK